MWLQVDFPRSCIQEALRALQLLQGILLAKGLVQTKASLSSTVPVEVWAPTLTQDVLQKPAWWPAG